MQKLLEDQELDRFFVEKLQAEAILKASTLFQDEKDPIESKTVSIVDTKTTLDSSSTSMSRQGFDIESQRLGECNICGHAVCTTFLTSETRYNIMNVGFIILTIFSIFSIIGMFVASTYVVQQYVNNPSSSSRSLMKSFADSVFYVNIMQLVSVFALCVIGIRIGRFERHVLFKLSTILDIFLLSLLICVGIYATQYEDERFKYMYVLFNAGHSGFSLTVSSFRLVPITWSLLIKCCETGHRSVIKKTKGHRNNRCNALECIIRPFRAKCPSLSFATCIRTFRCVSCFIPSRMCKFSSMTSCDCVSRYGLCCDVVDVEYVEGNEGLVEMKIDLENQCNVLLETMKTEDITVKDPAFHHYAARMRWRITRLKRQIQYRLQKTERKKYEYERMKHHNNCFACGVRFDNWIQSQNYCRACGYAFCAKCVGNVRPLDDLGLKHSNICDQCSREVDKKNFEGKGGGSAGGKKKEGNGVLKQRK